jgi:integrase
MAKKLTDATVRALPAPEKNAKIYYDLGLTGFGVRVTPNGAKTFILRYRNDRGVERKMRIGGYPEWGTSAAREEARRLLREERDPLAKREALRAEPTVNEILDEYLKSTRFLSKAESTQATDRGRIDHHLRPLLGKKHITDLTLDDVERCFASISAGKTAGNVRSKKARGLARVRGGEGTARKAIRLLRAALGWAVQKKLIAENAAIGAEVGSDGSREVVLDAEGYAAMFAALNKLEAAKEITAPVADAIRLISLTGARRGEIVRLDREFIDAKDRLIVLPKGRHKTGKATGAPRTIGLPAEAMALLERQGDVEVLFDFDPSVISKAWRVVRVAGNLPAGIGLHGLRHSAASHLAMDGASAAEIMTALGHRQMSTSQKYIHWAQNRRQELSERTASVALQGMHAPEK